MKKSYLLSFMILALPIFTFAQGDGLFQILGTIRNLIGAIVPIVIGLAVLYFLWGVMNYVTASDSEKQQEARRVMIMGIIILFVMVSVWGLVGLLQKTFDLTDSNAPTDVYNLIP